MISDFRCVERKTSRFYVNCETPLSLPQWFHRIRWIATSSSRWRLIDSKCLLFLSNSHNFGNHNRKFWLRCDSCLSSIQVSCWLLSSNNTFLSCFLKFSIRSLKIYWNVTIDSLKENCWLMKAFYKLCCMVNSWSTSNQNENYFLLFYYKGQN